MLNLFLLSRISFKMRIPDSVQMIMEDMEFCKATGANGANALSGFYPPVRIYKNLETAAWSERTRDTERSADFHGV
jgi:hypothetical protein